MAECGSYDSETVGLGHLFRSRPKYGTTAHTVHRDDVYVKHKIKPEETLQGISLSYGVTIEQIRRVNNLWTNDSLFLRSHIHIPVPRTSANENIATNGEESADPPCAIVDSQDEIVSIDDLRRTKEPNAKSENAECPVAPLSSKDFLSKFDTSLAQIRSSVEKLEEKSNFPDDPHNPLSHLPVRQHSNNSRHRVYNRDSSELEVSREPDLLIVSSRGRQSQRMPRWSAEDLEQKQDDLFEL